MSLPERSPSPAARSTSSTRPTCWSSARARWACRGPCGVTRGCAGCSGRTVRLLRRKHHGSRCRGLRLVPPRADGGSRRHRLGVRATRQGDGRGGARKPVAVIRTRLGRLQAGRRPACGGGRHPRDAAPPVRRTADGRRGDHRRRHRVQGRAGGDPGPPGGRRDRRRRRGHPSGRAGRQDTRRGDDGGVGDVPPRRCRQGGVPQGRRRGSADVSRLGGRRIRRRDRREGRRPLLAVSRQAVREGHRRRRCFRTT